MIVISLPPLTMSCLVVKSWLAHNVASCLIHILDENLGEC